MARDQCSGIASDGYPKDERQKEPQHLQLCRNKGIRDLGPVYRASQRPAKKKNVFKYLAHIAWVVSYFRAEDSKSTSSIGNPRSPFWFLYHATSVLGQLYVLTLHWSIKCNRKYRYKDILGTRRPWKKLCRCMERRRYIYEGGNIYSLRANNRGRVIYLANTSIYRIR